MWCAKRGHQNVAELILSYGGQLGNNANTKDLLTAEDYEGVTALHYAARAGHNGVLNALLMLARNLDIDIVGAMNIEGSTPLHWAARKNNVNGLRMLLKHDADPTQENKWGATALDNAVYAPNGAYNAIAVLSKDATQIKEALRSAQHGPTQCTHSRPCILLCTLLTEAPLSLSLSLSLEHPLGIH